MAGTAALLTLLALPAQAAMRMDGSDADGPAWVRIQLAGRATQATVDALHAAGITHLQYVPDDAYVAYASPAVAAAARRARGVSSVAPVPATAKLAGDLAGDAGTQGPIPIAVTSAGSSRAAIDAVARLGRIRSMDDLKGDGSMRVTEALVPARAAASLAARPDVLAVAPSGLRWSTEDEGSGQTLARNTPAGIPVPGYGAFLSGLGIDGTGVTMAIVDDGIDENHPEFTGRVQRFVYGPGTQGPPEGHGTHVAGIVGGKGAAIGPTGPRKDSAGLQYGLGIAPGVKLIDQPAIKLANTLGPTKDFPPAGGFETYSRDSVRAGAVGWNASWTDGGGAGVGYNANAASLDALARDADRGTAGNQPFSFVFSAGNSGPNARTITSPKEAKNILTVASSKGHRAGNIDEISSFSSRGPAKDNRIVPNITAPGETIVSARATSGVMCTAPLSGKVADSPPPDGLGLYTGCSGTSMASPQVAGSVALIHQWWRKANAGADSSPAMDRALLINGATDLGKKDVPNSNEGWGRVDLRYMFDPTTARVLDDQRVVLTDPGQVHSLRVQAVDPAKPMRVTVAWTDAPGAPGAAKALVNDLDLTVTGPDGVSFKGNRFALGTSVTGGTADRLNNVENVWLNSASGVYDIAVSAFNLPADGVPGAGDGTDQDFALVITNATLAP